MDNKYIAFIVIVLALLSLFAAILFTGILSNKKHGKINLILTLAILIYGIILMILTIIDRDSYYPSFEIALVYGVVALAAWITDNQVLKIIRYILVLIATLILLFFIIMTFLVIFTMPDLSGLRGLC